MQQLTGRWINGPRFLTLPEEQWPVQTATPSPAEHNMERRNVNAVSAASQVDIGNVIDPKVFTSWRKLIRITAWLGRLIENIRSRRNQLGGREGLLTPEDGISKSGDVMDQKCTEKPTEATGEWRIQDIEPIC